MRSRTSCPRLRRAALLRSARGGPLSRPLWARRWFALSRSRSAHTSRSPYPWLLPHLAPWGL
eukprot:3080298-Alexandrium_andersonii.AAC.1